MELVEHRPDVLPAFDDPAHRGVQLLAEAQPPGIAVAFSRDDADHRVLADAGRLEQTLSNLATNACDAMPPTGLIDILLTRSTTARWR